MSDASGVPPKLLTVGDRAGHPFHIFWSPAQPDRIHMATNDPAFVDEQGLRPGLRVVDSSSPRSVDDNPRTFNRLARALRQAGAAAPDDVPLLKRHLRYREAVNSGPSRCRDDDLPEAED